MVIRVQRLRFAKLRRALLHRLPESEVEYAYRTLREAETLGGQKNLRKNSSLVELVVAYSELETQRLKDIEDIEKEKERLLIGLRDTLGFSPTSVVVAHQKDGRLHFHILFVPRSQEGKKVDWSFKLHSQYLSRVLPSQDFQKLRRKEKKIGAYPLWLIRELEKTYGEKETRRLIRLARKRKLLTQELMNSHAQLYEELQTQKTQEERRRRRWRGLRR